MILSRAHTSCEAIIRSNITKVTFSYIFSLIQVYTSIKKSPLLILACLILGSSKEPQMSCQITLLSSLAEAMIIRCFTSNWIQRIVILIILALLNGNMTLIVLRDSSKWIRHSSSCTLHIFFNSCLICLIWRMLPWIYNLSHKLLFFLEIISIWIM